MKKVLSMAAIIAAFLLLLPLTVLGQPQKATLLNVKVSEIKPQKTFKILRTKTNVVEEISYDDYIFGVVAAEMPALYEAEALKAQAVAAHTFALHRQATNSDKEYDITDDFTIDQAFITIDEAAERWGDKADEYTKKIKAAVSATKNLAVTYNNEIILSVYHAISPGKTEDCKNVWGSDLPYLVSVSSVGDKLSSDYISSNTATLDDIKTLFPNLKLNNNPNDYFKNITKTNAGKIKTLTICGNQISGSEIREKLNLRSCFFEVSYKDNIFTFTVYGYGHGVGMSQNGANYMAQQGADFKEILCHYYTNCKIEEIV